ncbi:hypothetical protein Ahy_B08g092491 isoform B [Arachis hypogaea]|uniref:Uncharacterized protein n=1 Tax=Arachis hypogaea TaxID=3818 RepID=A0A444Y406_ARAHY|nr:hypothetical protein Ahy_B08g092491 isoform B [Arachis hypogaea]
MSLPAETDRGYLRHLGKLYSALFALLVPPLLAVAPSSELSSWRHRHEGFFPSSPCVISDSLLLAVFAFDFNLLWFDWGSETSLRKNLDEDTLMRSCGMVVGFYASCFLIDSQSSTATTLRWCFALNRKLADEIAASGEDINMSISHAADSIGLKEIPRYEVKIIEEDD